MTQVIKSAWRPRLLACIFVATVLIAASMIGSHIGLAQTPNPPRASGWLKALPPDKQIEAIDRQFRGFDMAMFEVNYR